MQSISEYRLPSNRTSRLISIRKYRVAVVECVVKVRTKVVLSVFRLERRKDQLFNWYCIYATFNWRRYWVLGYNIDGMHVVFQLHHTR